MTPLSFLLLPLLCSAPDEIVVRGKRAQKAIRGDKSGHNISVKVQKELGRARSLGEALSSHPGIQQKTTGGLGHLSLLLLRGSSPSQVSWFFDGFRLGGGVGGTLDVSQLPMAGVKRVQVFKSAVPMEFGMEGIGGAVNITPRIPKRREVVLTHTLGSFSTMRTAFFFGEGGGIPFSLSGSYLTTLGNYRYFHDNGTEYTREDDQHRLRENNAASRVRLLGASRFRLRGHGISLYALYLYNDNGVPGAGAMRSTSTTYTYHRGSGIGVLRGRWGRVRYELGGIGDLFTDHYYDPLGELGVGVQDDTSTLLRGGVRALLRYRSGAHNFALGPRLRFEQVHLRRMLQEGDKTYRRDQVTLGGRYRYDGAALFAQASLLGLAFWERGEGRFFPGGRLGAGVRLLKEFRFMANASLAVRIPSFLERFGDTGALKGNDALEPERSRSLDGGLQWERRWVRARFRGRLAVFHRRVEDLIQYIPNSQFVARAENISYASLTGTELSLAGRLGRTLKGRLSYTWLTTTNHSKLPYQEGNPLAGRPVHALFVHIAPSLSLGRVRITPSYSFSGQWGGNFDTAARRPMPSRVFHSAAVSFRPRSGSVNFALIFKNIGMRSYEMVERLPAVTGQSPTYPQAVANYLGYPIPGFSWYVSLSTKL